VIGIRDTQKTVLPALKCLTIFDHGQAGDNAAFCLRGLKKTDVERGRYCQAGSVTPHTF
jgi:translation elongation factor EF-Tu-like GTPase